MKQKETEAVKAAKINARAYIIGAIVTGVIGVVIAGSFGVFKDKPPSPSMSATTAGNNSPAVNMSGSTSGNNSPSIQAAPGAIVNNSGNSTFSIGPVVNGTATIQNGNNDRIVYNVYNTKVIEQPAQVVRDIVTDTKSTSPDWIILTNDLIISVNSYIDDHISAYEHANDAIKILQRTNDDLEVLSTNAGFMATLYLMAALSLDATEINPQLAYDWTQKSFTLSPNQNNSNTIAIVSANLADEFFKKGDYTNALGLIHKTVKIYEADPQWFENKMPPGFVFSWYQQAAWLAANVGRFNESEIYALKAYNIEPSEKQLQFLSSIFLKLGYHIFPIEVNPKTPNALDGFYKFALWKNDDFVRNVKRLYLLDTNNQIVDTVNLQVP
jgi:tetratricopeptide (TPR) repeat protein